MPLSLADASGFQRNGFVAPALGLVCAIVCATILLCASPAVALAQAPEVIVQVERDQIYEGESVRYQVFVNHIDNPAEPKLVGFDAFDVRSAGSQEVNQSSITIINGRRREIVRRGIAYDYMLTPKTTGELEIPAPVIEVDGKQLEARSLRISVIAAEDQDVAILEMTTSHTSVYPMQPFDLTLTVFVHPLPEPAEDRDPLAVQNPLVELSLPWAEDDELPNGVEGKVPGQRWLSGMRSRRGGFSVNGQESNQSLFGSAFGGFFDELPEGYRPTAERIRRANSSGRRLEYWRYTFTRKFVGTKVGKYNFGPATIKGTFGTKVNTRGQLEGEPVYAFAKAVSVEVKDVPLAGRPSSYSGAVGRFDIGADISPREAKVGDPMTLTLWFRGTGTLENALAPKLEDLDGFADAFKVYEATEETRGDSRLFTYSVRPKDVTTDEVPSIPMSYFDVDKEEFVTLKTEPIAISVDEADRLENTQIAMATPTAAADESIESRSDGIFANVTDLGQLKNETVHPDRWFLSLGGLTGLFFVVAVATQRWQQLRSDTGLQRRRGAVGDARRRLRSAIDDLERGNTRGGAEGVSDALLGLVADATDTPHGVLTAADASDKLRELGVAKEVVDQVRSVVSLCDDARYGAVGDPIKQLTTKANETLESLVRAMKGQRLLS